MELGEKAREFERILSLDGEPREVAVRDVLAGVESVADAYPEATISLSCPGT